jgi:hypothetical protein
MSRKIKRQIEEFADTTEEEILFADGYDDAIIGLVRQFNKFFVVYDTHKILSKLQAQGMSEEEAVEFFEFNIVGAYVGDSTPAFTEIFKG